MSSAHAPRPPPPPPPADRASGSGTARVQLFPAEITAVHSAEALQAALAGSARDIEIRAHLDLRTLPLQSNPSNSNSPYTYFSEDDRETDLAFLRWPTRSIRGHCSTPANAEPATSLERFQAELHGPSRPLKPYQCLLLTDTNTFHISTANGLWMDNIYWGYTSPRTTVPHIHGEVLSAGARRFLNLNKYDKPINIFLTNVTFQGHGISGLPSRLLGITPSRSKTSLLIQDSEFVGLAGREPPFLFAFGAYATFKDCLFKDVHLPRSELFDVSHFGTVTLLNCRFSNVSTHNGLTDTTYNDSHPRSNNLISGDYHLIRDMAYYDEYYLYEYLPVYTSLIGGNDHFGYDFEKTPVVLPPAALASTETGMHIVRHGDEQAVLNDTVSDCLSSVFANTEFVLPGCPATSVQVRRQQQRAGTAERVMLLRDQYSEQSHAMQTAREATSPGWNEYRALPDADTQRGKRRHPFYSQYYNEEYSYILDEHFQAAADAPYLYVPYAPAPYAYGYDSPAYPSEPAAAPRNYADSRLDYESYTADDGTVTGASASWVYETVVPLLGEPLDEHHPWFVAVQQELPSPLAGRDGLPISDSSDIKSNRSSSQHRDLMHKDPASSRRLSPGLAVAVAVTAVVTVAGAVAVMTYLWIRSGLRNRHWFCSICSRQGDPVISECGDQQCTSCADAGAVESRTAALYARTMHLSLSKELQKEPTEQGCRSSQGQTNPIRIASTETRLPQQISREIVRAPAMNRVFYYKLPTGLGLGVYALTSATGSAAVEDSDRRWSADLAPCPDIHEAGSGGDLEQRDQWPEVGSNCFWHAPHPHTSLVAMERTESAERGKEQQCDGMHTWSWPPSSTTTSMHMAPTLDVSRACTDAATVDRRAVQRLTRQLNSFGPHDLLLSRFELLGPHQRRHGGQAVVQFAVDPRDRREFAVKFFLQEEAFWAEAALYSAAFPMLSAYLPCCQPCTVSQVPLDAHLRCRLSSAGGRASTSQHCDQEHRAVATAGSISVAAAARFLPQVEAMCDSMTDPLGRPLPPCIVMEKGESLQDWSNRAQPDLFTSLAVLSNVAERLAVMHEAGYVHRDLKPANVMWLPRENRWTVIDFGCAARVGEEAPLSFTLAYAPPEVVAAHEAGQLSLPASPTLDAWSLGVMAFELLTGSPAFNFLTEGTTQVIERLKGSLPLPWEENSAARRQLGLLKGPVLQLLQRSPPERICMRRFHSLAVRTFSGPTTDAGEHESG